MTKSSIPGAADCLQGSSSSQGALKPTSCSSCCHDNRRASSTEISLIATD